MRYLKGACGVTIWKRLRNEEVHKRCEIEVSLEPKGKSTLRCFGHMQDRERVVWLVQYTKKKLRGLDQGVDHD